MQTTTTFPVRFSGHVLFEFEAMLESGVDPVEEPTLHEVLDAVRNAKVVIKREWNPTYEARLSSVDAVKAFAKEVAYYRYHAEVRLSECDGWGRDEIVAVVNGCKTALKSANKVLVEAGLPEVTSYFN